VTDGGVIAKSGKKGFQGTVVAHPAGNIDEAVAVGLLGGHWVGEERGNQADTSPGDRGFRCRLDSLADEILCPHDKLGGI